VKARRLSVLLSLSLGCSAGGAAETRDAGDATSPRDAARDAGHLDGPIDRSPEASSTRDAAPDVATPATVLVRLANWSPDAPGLDFCLAPHDSAVWRGPILAGALGSGVLGRLTVLDESGQVDAGPLLDAQVDAGPLLDAQLDAQLDTAPDVVDAGSPDASPAPGIDANAPRLGVTFPRISPYVAVPPGTYDVRVVAAGASDCASPLFADRTDLSAFVAGTYSTLATVGDLNDEGTDPAIALVAFSDDTRASPAPVRVRFINGIPSVTTASFVQLGIYFVPIVSDVQFGNVGVDVDGGNLDSNDYLSLAPVSDANWFVIRSDQANAVLSGIYHVGIPAGDIATVVAIGGKSGASATAIGVLVCLDRAPIVAAETAACTLYEGPGLTGPVCPSCP